MKDLAYSIRLLRRHPRYTVFAALTLAAGIGVTAAMFSLLDAVVFRPLPVAAPEQLVDITFDSPGSRFGTVSYAEFLDIQQHAPGLKDIFAVGPRGVTLHHGGDTRLLRIHYVTGGYFPSLRIPMHLGRSLTQEDDRPDAPTPVAVINHHVWQERLGAPRDIIGRTIQLNNTSFTVIGVTARGFAGLDRTVRTDVWVAAQQAHFVVRGLRDELEDRGRRWFRVIGRLDDGAGVEQVRAGLDVLLARWRAADSRSYGDARLVVRSQTEGRREQRTQGLVLLALVGLVLLIACANVANLALARSEGRRREMAVRAAIGASRGALLRQMITENAIVAAAGGAAGLLLAQWLIRLVPSLLPPGAEGIVVDVRADARMAAFTLALAAVALLLAGVAPAWRASRSDITSGLKGGWPRSGGRRVHPRDVLVAAEIGLSAVVIIAAALLVRSFGHSLAIDPGFDTTKNVATFYIVPALKGYGADESYRFFEAARHSATALPGVTGASYGIRLPAQGNEAGWSSPVRIPGKEPPPGKDAFDIRYTMVGPDYFAVMGTKILQGRGFTDIDAPGSAPVAVISESMARQLWPGEDPIGKRISMGRQQPVEREIVGVARDIRIGGLYEAPEMYVYVPFAQHQQGFGLLLVESAVDAASLVPGVRRRIAEIDPSIPILAVSSFDAHMDLLLYEERRNAWIGLFAAVLALALGAIGIYGVVALAAARRTRELGIRAALGARRREIVRLLLARGAALGAAGGLLGVAGGVTAGNLLESQLHGIAPADPASIAAALLAVGLVALAANLVPALRAARVDPVTALRAE